MASKKDKKAKKKQEKQVLKQKQGQRKKPISAERFNKKNLFAAFALVVFTLLCFSTAINNEFVNWDDDKNFYENDNITTLNEENFWSNTKKIFTSPVIGGYNPLTVWTFAIEHQVFGLDKPHRWHLNNVILHLLCTFLVFFIGRRLGLNIWAAVLFAGLFGVHPMRVESVAWVTERKDVLFGFFYLTAIFYYLKYVTQEKKKLYMTIVVISFILSLFAKIQAVILPISMILIDYYFDGKLDIKKMLKKTPFFIGSIAIGLLGIKFLGEQGSLESIANFSAIQRIFIGSFQYTIYLIKSIVPFRMSPLYPYPASIPWYFYLSFLSFILSAVVMVWAYMKEKRTIFFGLGFFIANVFFLLQILGAGQGFLADRFTYIAYLGLFFIFSFYFQKLINSRPNLKNGALGLAAVVLLGYGFMTYNQNMIWENSGTLWTHVLKYYKNSTLPYGNRANYYRDNGQKVLALKDYNDRIRLKADDPGVFNSRARLFFNSTNQDTLRLALIDYNKAIDLKVAEINKFNAAGMSSKAQESSTAIAEYYVNRGATYAKLQDFNQALVNLNEGVKYNPNFVNAYNNRSVIYNLRQQFPEALADVNTYLQFKKFDANMWYEKSRLHNILGQPNESLAAANTALKYNNSKGLFYVERSKAYFSLNKFEEAKQDLSKARQMGVNLDQNLVNVIMSK